jgi:hypothetical protein
MVMTVSIYEEVIYIDNGLGIWSRDDRPRECMVCTKLTPNSSFVCPPPDGDKAEASINYWRTFFDILCKKIKATPDLNGEFTGLAVCSKECWEALIEPHKADILIELVKKLDN